jgi:hypothetical protein
MSKSVTRIVLSALISLGVIVGIYTSVKGASLGGVSNRTGTHLVSGAKVNLNHYRLTSDARQYYEAQLENNFYNSGKGHGCERDGYNSLDD